jgi:hypothetical protein
MKLGAFDHLVFTAAGSLYLQNLATTDLKQARRFFEVCHSGDSLLYGKEKAITASPTGLGANCLSGTLPPKPLTMNSFPFTT